ncbi:MAG: Coenzyme F420 hydrogenase/dehydrogenase, beta subunit C-terminal domain [Candidatus Lokiarchaeota archaeon]|nr:Coenzyme F420 hydrogenase/dehydrogenase, beta subunit C-terminal domain [Candidatus Lokiarchaeota archaeon]
MATEMVAEEMHPEHVRQLPLLLHAARSFRIRCLVDAKADIEKAGALDGNEYDDMLGTLLDEEVRKAAILREIEAAGCGVNLEGLAQKGQSLGIPGKAAVAAAFQLAFEGFVRCDLDGPDAVSFTFVTEDSSKIQPVYVPVKVVDEGKACSGCGACQAVCPVDCISVDDGKVTIDMDRCIRCGLCLTACPRALLPRKAMEWAMMDKPATPEDLKTGVITEAWCARITREDLRPLVQDGGVSSALLIHAFESKAIQAAIGAARAGGVPWKPEAIVMKGVPDVVRAAGTKYVNTPSMRLLRIVKRERAIAVVGTPCMMQALRKAEVYPSGTVDVGNIKYRIGIFCMESFTHAGIKQLCEGTFETPLDQVRKMNIKEGQFFAYPTSGEPKSASMKDVTKLARLSCHCCHDLTSELADVSVGSIGSPDGWNTVIIRTSAGKELFDAAVQSGLIEKRPIDEVQPGLPLVKKLSFAKKRSYEKTEAKRVEEKGYHPAYFLKLPPPPPPKKKEGAPVQADGT